MAANEEHALLKYIETPTSKPTASEDISVTGLLIAGMFGGAALLLSATSAPFLTPAFRRVCIPYVPATDTQVKNVFQALKGRRGRLVDLGSGDGRIVFEAAKRGFSGVGVELNASLVLYSKIKALSLGLSSSAKFHRQNLWSTKLSAYDQVVIFGVDTMMEPLEVKCCEEMPSGSAVVACRFPFPNLEPVTTVGEGVDTVWLYEISAPISTPDPCITSS